MLGSVRVARPEHQNERFVAGLEQRQHRLCRNGGKIILLHSVGRERAGRRHVAEFSIGTARRGGLRQVRRFEPVDHFRRQRNAFAAAGCVVDNDGPLSALLGVIEDQGRADLADGSRAVALVTGELQDRRLVEIIPRKMLIDIGKNRVAFQERGQRAAGTRNLETCIDRIGEIPRVAQHVTGRHRGRIRGGESREQRMAVAQIHTLTRDRRHGRSSRIIDHAEAQAVGHEQNHVVRMGRRRLRTGRSCRDRCPECHEDCKQAAHENSPLQAKDAL